MLCSTMNEQSGSSLDGNVTGGFREIFWQPKRTLSESFTGHISHYNQSESISCWHKLLSRRGWGVILSPFFSRLWMRFGRIQTFVPGPFSMNRCLAWPFKHSVSFTRHKSMRFSHQRKKYLFAFFGFLKRTRLTLKICPETCSLQHMKSCFHAAFYRNERKTPAH